MLKSTLALFAVLAATAVAAPVPEWNGHKHNNVGNWRGSHHGKHGSAHANVKACPEDDDDAEWNTDSAAAPTTQQAAAPAATHESQDNNDSNNEEAQPTTTDNAPVNLAAEPTPTAAAEPTWKEEQNKHNNWNKEENTDDSNKQEGNNNLASGTTGGSGGGSGNGMATFYNVMNPAENHGYTPGTIACYNLKVTDYSSYAAVTSAGFDDNNCGKMISVSYNGKTITVPVIDTCATCDASHIDLDVGSFTQLAPQSQGEIHGIEWHYV